MVQIRALRDNKAVRGITTPTMMYQPRDEQVRSLLTDRGKWLGPIQGLSLVTDRGGGGCWEGQHTHRVDGTQHIR